MSNIFVSNKKLKLVKTQAKAKQNPEAVLLLFENICFLHPRYYPKNTKRYSKNAQKASASVLMRLYH